MIRRNKVNLYVVLVWSWLGYSSVSLSLGKEGEKKPEPENLIITSRDKEKTQLMFAT